QLLHARGNARARARSRISKRPAHTSRDTRRALLRGPDGWPSSANQFRGIDSGDYLDRLCRKSLFLACGAGASVKPGAQPQEKIELMEFGAHEMGDSRALQICWHFRRTCSVARFAGLKIYRA